MNLFHTDFSKPGPGVAPDEPRKKGIARMAEIIGRDMGVLFVAGGLALISALPFIAGLWFAVYTHAWLIAVIAGVVGGAVAAPVLCGFADTVLRMLRDEPFYWWDTYRRSWKRNWKACLAPGAVLGLLAAMDIFAFMHVNDSGAMIISLVGLGLLCGLGLYIIAQLALVELPIWGIVRNAILLLLGWLPRTLAAVTILLCHGVLVLIFFPATVIEMIILGSWFPLLWALFVIYPALDTTFHVEESIREMNKEKYPEPEEKRK